MPKDYGNNKTERNELKRLGAKAHPNSGRGMVKGDGSDDTFVIDVKEAAKSFSLNEKVWSKVCTDAYKVDPYKQPMLAIILGVERPKRLAIVDLDWLIGVLDDNDPE